MAVAREPPCTVAMDHLSPVITTDFTLDNPGAEACESDWVPFCRLPLSDMMDAVGVVSFSGRGVWTREDEWSVMKKGEEVSLMGAILSGSVKPHGVMDRAREACGQHSMLAAISSDVVDGPFDSAV